MRLQRLIFEEYKDVRPSVNPQCNVFIDETCSELYIGLAPKLAQPVPRPSLYSKLRRDLWHLKRFYI